MEDTLTTAPAEEQVDTTVEPATETEPEVNETNETSYDDAWDNINLDDDKSVDAVLNEKSETVETADEDEVASEEVEATEAFMKAAPVLNFKGKDIPIESQEEIIALAQKGFSFESEMAKIKPQKKVLNTVEDVPLEVLQAVADLEQGKTGALDYLKNHYGIEDKTSDDIWDDNDEVKTESTYKPEIVAENPVKDYWDEYAQSNTEAAAKVSDVYKDLDQSFQAELYKPDVFPAFVQSVSSGEFDEVYPIAMKERTLNPALRWIDAYAAAAQKVGQQPAKRNDPPASAQVPSTKEPRNVSEQSAADRIWEDNDYFDEMNRNIFS